jgi:hypothetical protein
MGGKNRKGGLVRRRGGKELRVRREKGIERKRRYIEQRVRRKKEIDWKRSYRVEGEKGERD